MQQLTFSNCQPQSSISVNGRCDGRPCYAAQVKEAKVVAVGPGRRAVNGELIEPGVKEGDHVLMPDYGGQEVDLDGSKCAARSAST